MGEEQDRGVGEATEGGERALKLERAASHVHGSRIDLDRGGSLDDVVIGYDRVLAAADGLLLARKH